MQIDTDRVIQEMVGGMCAGTRQLAKPMDAYLNGEFFLIQLDLRGVSADSVELTAEDSVLTIKAERPSPSRVEDVVVMIVERPHGTFIR